MEGNIKPLNVSPFIRGARYILLICGISYGILKMKTFRAIEESARPGRLKMYADLHEKEHWENDRKVKADLVVLADIFEVKGLPEGWEQDIK